ncbi:MAG: hypothetical protein PWQ17_961 [Anaerophaga sp.]|nr:hypothetical protein [Anaerophaga sp.]MDN5290716.1 hypothetical protein [Anaerophaga sp.]
MQNGKGLYSEAVTRQCKMAFPATLNASDILFGESL